MASLDQNLKDLWNQTDYDLLMNPMTIEPYFWEQATTHWSSLTYNLVILSPVFEDPTNMHQMVGVYSKLIWSLMMVSLVFVTVSVAVTIYLSDWIRNEHGTNSVFDIFFEMMRHLLNQSGKSELNDNGVALIWSLVALILIEGFSAAVLDSVVRRPKRPIDSIEELAATNLTVFVNDNSWLAWQFKGVQLWNKPLDENLDSIKHKIKFLSHEEFRQLNPIVKRKKAVLVSEFWTLYGMKFGIYKPSDKYDFGEDKYYEALIGFPINKTPSKAREQLLSMIAIMVESGFHLRSDQRKLNYFQIPKEGDPIPEYEKDKGPLQPVALDLIKDLYILTSMCYAASSMVILIELFYQRYSRKYNLIEDYDNGLTNVWN